MNRALRAATIGVLLLSPVVLSACSAGQTTQTATQERDKTGAQAQVGDISIREGKLVSPPGGSYQSGDDAELQAALINNGSQDDALVSVDGKGFSSARISTGASIAGSTSSSSSSSAPTSGATPSAAPTSGTGTSAPSASSSAAPTSSPIATSSSGAGSERIVIPAGHSVFIGGGQYTVTLTNLSESLTPGQYLEVTLTFEKAGEVTIPVTVENPSSSVPRSSSFDFHQQKGGSENAAPSSEAANK